MKTTEQLTDGEFKALINLLDDSDEEVFRHVEDKLKSIGLEAIPRLEEAWEEADHILLQNRLEEIISDIHHSTLKDELTSWMENDSDDVLLGAILIAKFKYPELDITEVYQQVDKLKQNIWLELNNGLTPMEEVNVINHVLYVLHGYTCDEKDNFVTDEGYINRVLETKKGNSLTLGIIYLVVAIQNEIPVYGISLPYHFVLGYSKKELFKDDLDNFANAKDILFYVNPMNDGSLFSKNDIHNYLGKLKVKEDRKYFAPCSNIEIIKALIKQQIRCYKEAGDEHGEKGMEELLLLFT